MASTNIKLDLPITEITSGLRQIKIGLGGIELKDALGTSGILPGALGNLDIASTNNVYIDANSLTVKDKTIVADITGGSLKKITSDASVPSILLDDGTTSNTLDNVKWSGQIQTVNTTANLTHYLNFSDSSGTGYGKPQKTSGIACNPSTNTMTMSNLTFQGTGSRITANMNNAVHANRFMFQTTNANSASIIGIIPSGTGNTSLINVYGSSDPDNSNYVTISGRSTGASIGTSSTGTGVVTDFSILAGGNNGLTVNATTGVCSFTQVPTCSIDPTTATQLVNKSYVDRIGTTLTNSSSSAASGVLSGALIYTDCSITLTPGTWMVQGQLSLYMGTNNDSCYCGLYNRTSSSEITSGKGVGGAGFIAYSQPFSSNLTIITVASNTQICPYANRNGASQLFVPANGNVVGGIGGNITAVRIA